MIPPALVLIMVGKGAFMLPIPIPVFMLWPVLYLVVVVGLINRDRRAMNWLRLASAFRGFRLRVRGKEAQRFSLLVM